MERETVVSVATLRNLLSTDPINRIIVRISEAVEVMAATRITNQEGTVKVAVEGEEVLVTRDRPMGSMEGDTVKMIHLTTPEGGHEHKRGEL